MKGIEGIVQRVERVRLDSIERERKGRNLGLLVPRSNSLPFPPLRIA